MVRELTPTDNLDELLKDKLVVIDFFAEWCPPCKMIGPIFVELAEKHKEITFFKANTGTVQQFASKFGVKSIPTFIFFKNGAEVDRLVGANKADLEKKIEALKK